MLNMLRGAMQTENYYKNKSKKNKTKKTKDQMLNYEFDFSKSEN